MKAVVAIDSLKGSLSSMEAGNAIAEGIYRADAEAKVEVRPLADGGEGTVDALVQGMNGSLRKVRVTGPLGDKVDAAYGIIEEAKMAVIEMSAAAGQQESHWFRTRRKIHCLQRLTVSVR